MSFTRPTLKTIHESLLGDIDQRLPGANARLRRSLLGVLAAAVAGVVWGLYCFLDWIFRQVFVDSADDEMVLRHGAIWGVSRKPGALASGVVEFRGQDGAAVRRGLLLQAASGAQYVTTGETLIKGGTAHVNVQALHGGPGPHPEAAALLSLVSPELGLEPKAIVEAGGIGGGAEPETTEQHRQRILDRIQHPPAGGNDADYLRWAKEVPGVTRAWVRRNWVGRGTVGILVDGADEKLLAAVRNHIAPKAPVAGAELYVVAPTPKRVTVSVARLEPDTPSVRAAIEAELADLVARASAPGGTIPLSHIREAVSIAAGEYDHDLVAPRSAWKAEPHEIIVFGGVEWGS